MLKNRFVSGLWNIMCDICQVKMKSDEARKRWDGFITCKECWDPRHPLDFIRAYQKEDTLPFTRPEADDQFVTGVTYITPPESTVSHR